MKTDNHFTIQLIKMKSFLSSSQKITYLYEESRTTKLCGCTENIILILSEVLRKENAQSEDVVSWVELFQIDNIISHFWNNPSSKLVQQRQFFIGYGLLYRKVSGYWKNVWHNCTKSSRTINKIPLDEIWIIMRDVLKSTFTKVDSVPNILLSESSLIVLNEKRKNIFDPI